MQSCVWCHTHVLLKLISPCSKLKQPFHVIYAVYQTGVWTSWYRIHNTSFLICFNGAGGKNISLLNEKLDKRSCIKSLQAVHKKLEDAREVQLFGSPDAMSKSALSLSTEKGKHFTTAGERFHNSIEKIAGGYFTSAVRYGNAQRSSLCKRYHWHRCYFLNA